MPDDEKTPEPTEPEPKPTVAQAARDMMREGKMATPPDLDGGEDEQAQWDELERRTGETLR